MLYPLSAAFESGTAHVWPPLLHSRMKRAPGHERVLRMAPPRKQ
jgi:hypothetical protein